MLKHVIVKLETKLLTSERAKEYRKITEMRVTSLTVL